MWSLKSGTDKLFFTKQKRRTDLETNLCLLKEIAEG